MAKMSKAQIRTFLTQGTFTGKLATVKKEGSSHVVPIWFVVDKRIVKVILFLPLVVLQSKRRIFAEIKG
jgi:nitroimidazol reductase NimA-like FMN-containing flavoprotein (pyridoxamine 5'-phosphate oxidase superfamily)